MDKIGEQKAQEKIKAMGERFDEVYVEHKSTMPSKRHSGYNQVIEKRKKKKTAKKIIIGALLFLLMLILVGVSTLFIMINSGKNQLLDYDNTKIETVPEATLEDDGKTVRYNGKIYRLNEDITSIACLGIDKDDINQQGVIGTSGQADTIMVIAFDTQTGATKIISIPRDTIVSVDIYDTEGSFARTEETQICLAYAYGDGGLTSCENTIASLQKMMFGIPIKSYGALELGGIGALNDAIGGVTVTPNESFYKFVKGQSVKLKGDDALTFVRYRDKAKVYSNLTRMSRQMEFVKGFARNAVDRVTKDVSVITDIYNTATKYSYTNVSLSTASYLATTFVTKADGNFETFSVPGKMIAGDDAHSEYILDEKSFYETILAIYYNEAGTY